MSCVCCKALKVEQLQDSEHDNTDEYNKYYYHYRLKTHASIFEIVRCILPHN